MNLESLKQQFANYHVVLEPDRDEPEWWAGAPSVCRDNDGVFWMACRMREGESPRGVRGYEIRLLRSEDGMDFEVIGAVPREDVPIPGFERPAILYNPSQDNFSLFGCGPYNGGPWCILRFDDADDPAQFVPSSCRAVIAPAPKPEAPQATHISGYKDPFIFVEDGTYHCFTIGSLRVERTYHFTSHDGEDWDMVGDGPAYDAATWHTFYTRPAAVLPLGVGYLYVYEGSDPTWYDPGYNIATGLAWTPDLYQFVDLTPRRPLLKSTTPGDYHTWRYSHWMWVDGEMFVYAEVARPNSSNEIRMWRFPAQF